MTLVNLVTLACWGAVFVDLMRLPDTYFARGKSRLKVGCVSLFPLVIVDGVMLPVGVIVYLLWFRSSSQPAVAAQTVHWGLAPLSPPPPGV